MRGAMALRMLAALSLGLLCRASNEEGEAFLAENAQKPGVLVLPSGLQYRVIKSGPTDGPTPNISSPCICHYKGRLPSGVVFDSSHKRGPATFAPNQVQSPTAPPPP
eukprot:SAG22_NODE_1547_length_4151_cov_3.067868_6_plen_107_part_00